ALPICTSYTSSVAVLDGPHVLYVDRVASLRRGSAAVELDLQPGSRLPAHCTALGKLLLAHLPDEEQRELIGTIDLARRAPNTITSRRALREELAAIRSSTLAVSD